MTWKLLCSCLCYGCLNFGAKVAQAEYTGKLVCVVLRRSLPSLNSGAKVSKFPQPNTIFHIFLLTRAISDMTPHPAELFCWLKSIGEDVKNRVLKMGLFLATIIGSVYLCGVVKTIGH